jgi:hypothetical protein
MPRRYSGLQKRAIGCDRSSAESWGWRTSEKLASPWIKVQSRGNVLPDRLP